MMGGRSGGGDTTQLLLRRLRRLAAVDCGNCKAPLESLWCMPLAAGLREPRRGGPQTGTPLALSPTIGRELEPRRCGFHTPLVSIERELEPRRCAGFHTPLAMVAIGREPEPRRCGFQTPLVSIERVLAEPRRCGFQTPLVSIWSALEPRRCGPLTPLVSSWSALAEPRRCGLQTPLVSTGRDITDAEPRRCEAAALALAPRTPLESLRALCTPLAVECEPDVARVW